MCSQLSMQVGSDKREEVDEHLELDPLSPCEPLSSRGVIKCVRSLINCAQNFQNATPDQTGPDLEPLQSFHLVWCCGPSLLHETCLAYGSPYFVDLWREHAARESCYSEGDDRRKSVAPNRLVIFYRQDVAGEPFRDATC